MFDHSTSAAAGALEEASPRLENPKTVPSGRGDTYSVLIVDDDPGFVSLVRRYLRSKSSCQFDLVSVSTCLAATETLRYSKFDCVLVDYCLPDATGLQIADSVRNRRSVTVGSPAPPVIVITAEGGEDAATGAIRVGAVDFISKRDVNRSSLQRAVINAIEKGRLETDIWHRMREIEEANVKLKKQNEEIRRFYHTISHEIKTPLTSIKEFISIVSDGLVGEICAEQQGLLGYALESCNQLNNHFNDLVDLTCFDVGSFPIRKTACSLDSVFARCIAVVEPACREKGITLTRRLDSPLPVSNIDRDRILQVMTNMCNNAVKFTPEGGSITLGCEADAASQQVMLSVSDSGCGIAQDDLPHIFDRLYQANCGEELMQTVGGLGLGLSIAQEIVSRHGSELCVSSEPGVGSTFCFALDVI